MDTLSYKTVSYDKEHADKQWVLIDAEGLVLGRLASVVAKMIRGKYKPIYTPHADCGDNVVVINAEKVQLTGNKLDGRKKFNYSGYPGGRHDKTYREMLEKTPTRVLEHAVKGMLPKNRLGRQLFDNLYVYAGPEHKQQAQSPKQIDINKYL